MLSLRSCRSTRLFQTSFLNIRSNVSGSPSFSIYSGWDEFCKSSIKVQELEKTRGKTLLVEGNYSAAQKERDQCWRLLLDAQCHLEDVHTNLDPLSNQDARYAELITKEVETLKKIRSLTLDFNLYDKVDKEKLKAYSATVVESLSAERECETRIFRFCAITFVVSLLFGSFVTFVYHRIKHYVFLEDTENNDYRLKNLADHLIWIRDQNNKLKKCFEDIWIAFGTTRHYSIDDKVFAFNTEDFVAETKDALQDAIIENENALKEMLVIEKAIYTLKQLKAMPVLVSVDESTTENKEKGLWTTTFAYGAAVVFTPLALLFMF